MSPGARLITVRDSPVIAIGVLGIALVLWMGTKHYDPYGQATAAELAARPYPWKGVLFFVAVIVGETALLYAILRPRSFRWSWARALLATIVFVVSAYWWTVFGMHAPSYYLTHVVWVLGIAAMCFVLFFIATIGRVRSRLNVNGPKVGP